MMFLLGFVGDRGLVGNEVGVRRLAEEKKGESWRSSAEVAGSVWSAVEKIYNYDPTSEK